MTAHDGWRRSSLIVFFLDGEVRLKVVQAVKNSKEYRSLIRVSLYARPYLLLLMLALLAIAAAAGAEGAFPLAIRRLLDQSFTPNKSPSMPWLVGSSLVGLGLVRASGQFTSDYLISYAKASMTFKVREELIFRTLHCKSSIFQEKAASEMIYLTAFAVDDALNVITGLLITIVRNLLTVAFLFFNLLYLNWRLTLFIAALFPVLGWLTGTINRRLRRLNQDYQLGIKKLSNQVEGVVRGRKVISLHNSHRYEFDRLNDVSRTLRSLGLRIALSGGVAQPLSQLLVTIALALICTVAILPSSHNIMTAGSFTAFITSAVMIISPLKSLVNVAQPLQRGVAIVDSVFSFIDESSEPSSSAKIEAREQDKSVAIEFRDVSFEYPRAGDKSHTTLDRISFKVHPGEVLALVGPSGGGKTTLLNLVPRFFEPNSGEILLNGIPLPKWPLHQLREQIALVSQDVVLFNDSIMKNVAYGKAGDRKRVEQALRDSQLWDWVISLPLGLDTIVGDNGAMLSGGQRQRLAIARALYKDTPILLLDEATSALDTESEGRLLAALSVLMHGRTTITITHRLSTIKHADQILVIQSGRVIERGRHRELIGRGGLYAKLVCDHIDVQPNLTVS